MFNLNLSVRGKGQADVIRVSNEKIYVFWLQFGEDRFNIMTINILDNETYLMRGK